MIHSMHRKFSMSEGKVKSALMKNFKDPAWADVFKPATQATEVRVADISLIPETKELFPELIGLFNSALQDANDASSLDKSINAEMFASIQITNNPKDPENIGGISLHQLGGVTGEKYTIKVFSGFVRDYDPSMLRAMLAHEIWHIHHIKRINAGATDEARQIFELEADRATPFRLAKIAELLATTSTKEGYRYLSTPPDHPTTRDRVKALLEAEYGNKIFKFSGEFGANHRFYPAREKNGVPVMENGLKVVNWDASLEPEIRKLVHQDMDYLDAMETDGFSAEEVINFLDHVGPRIAEFEVRRKIDVVQPSNEFIADQFKASLKDPTKVEVVSTMHPALPNTYKTLDAARAYVANLPQGQQVPYMNCIENNIIEAIRTGRFAELPTMYVSCRPATSNTTDEPASADLEPTHQLSH